MLNTIILFVWTAVWNVSLVIIMTKITGLTGDVGVIGTFMILWAFSLGARSIYRTSNLVERCEKLEARVKELEQNTW
jgi:hypothetical protein